eukprot:2450075-Karenia_brevis.AAC.1
MHEAKFAALEKKLALDDQVNAYQVNPDYDRPVDHTLVRLNCPNHVTRAKVLDAIQPWLGRDFTQDDWQLLPSANLATDFTIKFKG